MERFTASLVQSKNCQLLLVLWIGNDLLEHLRSIAYPPVRLQEKSEPPEKPYKSSHILENRRFKDIKNHIQPIFLNAKKKEDFNLADLILVILIYLIRIV